MGSLEKKMIKKFFTTFKFNLSNCYFLEDRIRPFLSMPNDHKCCDGLGKKSSGFKVWEIVEGKYRKGQSLNDFGQKQLNAVLEFVRNSPDSPQINIVKGNVIISDNLTTIKRIFHIRDGELYKKVGRNRNPEKLKYGIPLSIFKYDRDNDLIKLVKR